jgi:hypothetical protein
MSVLSGAVIDASDLMNAVLPPLAMLRQTAAQTLTTGGYAALNFDTEDFDSHNGHSTVTNTSRYTAVLAGIYEVSGGAAFAANATGRRLARLAFNGTVIGGSLAGIPANTATVGYSVRTTLVRLAVGDYVELQALQESGGNLATFITNAEFQSTMVVRWVSN